MLKVCFHFGILLSLAASSAATKKTDGAVPGLMMPASLSAGGLKEGGAACSSEQSGVPGSSFIQNSQNAAKMVLSRQSAASVHQISAKHLQTMDRATGNMITVFVVVAILLFIGVLGFVVLEASSRKKSARGVPAARASIPGTGRHNLPQQNDRFSTAREPMPRVSMPRPSTTKPVHRAARPSVPGTGMSAVGPSSSRSLTAPQAPPADAAGPQPSSLYLCGHELVVPDNTECNLIVPSIQSQRSTNDKVKIMINDTQGSSILLGEIYKAPLYDGTRIELKSREGANTWARCRDSGRGCLTLHSKDSSSTWGTIKMSADGMIDFRTSEGQKVSFDGPASGKMNIVDSHGILLGVSDLTSGGRSVRVGPLVDVGFVMIAHLAIDLLLLESTGRLR